MKITRLERRERVDRSRLDLKMLARHFEVHNQSEGKSARTVEWYNQALELFQNWLEAGRMSTCLEDLGEDEVREFILHLQTRKGLWGPASSHTVNGRVRALRAFFNWLHGQGYTEDHRLKGLRPPKVKEKVIEILTDEEVKRIFASINPNTLMGARNTAIIGLMLDTGLRLSEVVTLKSDDVHLQDRYIKVLGKGNKERLVAFGVKCQQSLLHYAHHYRTESFEPERGLFFLCIDGYPMTPDTLRSLTERLSKAAGVPRLHPHLLRHTYATLFLMNGGNVFLLQQNLGHTTLAMVEHYVHIASQKAALVSQSFSPLDRLDVQGTRRFRHGFNPENAKGKIYPNSGKSLSERGSRTNRPHSKR